MSQRPSFVFASLSILSLTAAACGGDDAPAGIDAAAHDAEVPDAEVPDAEMPDAMPPADLSCADTEQPTTGSNPIVIDGVASSAGIDGVTALEGVTAEAFEGINPVALATDTSDATGAYALTIANPAEMPVNGYIKGHASQKAFRDTYLYPPFPLTADTDQAPLLFISDETFGFFPIVLGFSQEDANGLIGVLVLDCAGNPVAGATVTSTPAGTVVYTDGTTPAPNATSTDASGIAFVFNVTAGDVLVDATVDGMSLDEHTVNARARTITSTALAPGPITPAQ